VRRLVGEPAPIGTHVTRRSVLSAAAVLIPLFVSGLAMAHPLHAAVPGGPASEHCAHHRDLPIHHLFCLGFSVRAHTIADCPHAMHSTHS
jgi:hypothetical protein